MKRFTHLTLAFGTVALLALLLFVAVGAQPAAYAAGDTIKVPDDYPTIQGAIDAAADGDTILVARTTFYEENLSITKGITLSGGWDANFIAREVPTYTTFLSGQYGDRVISITSATSDTVITIDGFTIKHGNATGLGGAPSPEKTDSAREIPRRMGIPDADPLTPAEHVARLRTSLADVVERGVYPGGHAAYQAMLERAERQIVQYDGSPVPLPATTDWSQQSADCGGGIYSWNASLHLLNSIIKGNIASLENDGSGGGVCIVQAPPSGTLVAGNIFLVNIASSASGATGTGGGLYVTQAPGAVIEDNVFHENVGSNASGGFSIGNGGGLAVHASPTVMLRRNELEHNTAAHGWSSANSSGGGAYMVLADGAKVVDNLFRENLSALHSGGLGGGLHVFRSNGVLINGNEVVKNWLSLIGEDFSNSMGGGIAVDSFDGVDVTDNVIWGNIATVSGPNIGIAWGGGLYVANGTNLSVTGNTITGNVTAQTGVGFGGGILLFLVSDAQVAENTLADNAGSLSDGYGGGGGLELQVTRNCVVRNNRFQGNLGIGQGDESSGGGLDISGDPFYPASIDTTVEANLFLDNYASSDPTEPSIGGACFARSDGFTFTNNVVAGNSASVGGALFLGQTRNTAITNNTLVGNHGASGVFVSTLNDPPIDFTNNIVVSHTVGISVTEGATATVSYTLWNDNETDIGGDGTINHTHPVYGDPAFVDPSNHDYHLTIGSAARDAGDPAGVPPAPDHDRDGVARPQGLAVDIGAYEWERHYQYLPLVMKSFYARTGWAIGQDENNAAAIVHTADGGLTWQAQGDSTKWTDLYGNDISAVDNQTAWAALSSGPGEPDGIILHTTNGGGKWVTQTIPSGLTGGIKGIKGLSRDEAWAASLEGVVLHTTDGGETWDIVPQPEVTITQVNRIDAMGSDVWIADAAEGGAVVHTNDGGQHWWAEYLPCEDSPLTVHAFSPQDVWASGSILPEKNPSFYRSEGGNGSWEFIKRVGANDHLDDICAASPDDVWGALNGEESRGRIWKVHVEDDGTPGGLAIAKEVTPPELEGLNAEGVTCLDKSVAWVAAQNERHFPGLPLGVIVHTTDGGETWTQQSAPTDIEYWKISFVGARR